MIKMNEEEKILKTIRYCANDYMKQEDGIQCFEWGDLWILHEYIEKIKQENKILRENAEHNDKVVDKVNWENRILKEVIEEVRKSLEDYQEYIDEAKEFYSDLEDDDVVKVSNLQILNNQMVRNYDLLQILDKAKEI